MLQENESFIQIQQKYKCSLFLYIYIYIYIPIYRVSQEEWIKLRGSVPYVKLYRYNPKHLYPKLNGYEDNVERKVWSSCGFHVLYLASCFERVTRHALSRSCLPCGVRDKAGRYAVALAPIDVHERQSAAGVSRAM